MNMEVKAGRDSDQITGSKGILCIWYKEHGEQVVRAVKSALLSSIQDVLYSNSVKY